MLPGAPFKGVDHVFHDIDTGDSQPQYTPPYPKSPAQLQIIKEEIQKMIEQDILEPSNSLWGALCILVKKKSEHGMKISSRLVVDYRKLNKLLNLTYILCQTFKLFQINWEAKHGSPS